MQSYGLDDFTGEEKNGLRLVRKGGKFGYIDKYDNEKIPAIYEAEREGWKPA